VRILEAIIKRRKDLIRRNRRVKPKSRSELVIERVNWLIRVIVIILIQPKVLENVFYPNILIFTLLYVRNLFFRRQKT